MKKRLMVAALINAHTQLANAALRVRSPSEIKAAAKRFRTRPPVGRTRLRSLISLWLRQKKKIITLRHLGNSSELLCLLLE